MTHYACINVGIFLQLTFTLSKLDGGAIRALIQILGTPRDLSCSNSIKKHDSTWNQHAHAQQETRLNHDYVYRIGEKTVMEMGLTNFSLLGPDTTPCPPQALARLPCSVSPFR